MTLSTAYRLARFARCRRRLARRGPLYVAYPEERRYGPYRPGARAQVMRAHAAGCVRQAGATEKAA